MSTQEPFEDMPGCSYTRVEIEAVIGCAGPLRRTLEEDAEVLFKDSPEQAARIRDFIGIHARHVAPIGVTSLDLCEKAAKAALEGVTPDAILFVTQTPDQSQPSNANLLHGRLGLGKHVACFDVNQGCSGWVYGLWMAGALVEAGGCETVLLCAGDTISQIVHPKDRAVVPLFGDAGSATLVRRRSTAGSPLHFSLHSDGSGSHSICVPHGGARKPISSESRVESQDNDGSIRSLASLYMNGLEVFNFTLREEPSAVKSLLAAAGVAASQLDHLVLHQANRFILTNLAKRIGVPLDRTPTETLREYGNQSSASIPFVLANELAESIQRGSKLVLASGFGVGLSWASVLGQIGPVSRCKLVSFN